MTAPLPSPPAALAPGRTRSAQVADWLAAAAAALPPGAHLGCKNDLRVQAGVSMATMNEALRLLENRGAVTVRPGPGGGVFAAQPDPLLRVGQALAATRGDLKSRADAVIMRTALDPLCVVDAARHRTDKDLADLSDQLAAAGAHRDDDQRLADDLWRFHHRLLQICHNDLLREVSLALLEILTPHPVTDTPAGRDERIRLHQALLDAVTSADTELCAKASRDHAAHCT